METLLSERGLKESATKKVTHTYAEIFLGILTSTQDPKSF
jgi:hypothetical protein